MTKKARKGVKETIEILLVNTILFTYRRCSIWLSPTSIHFIYLLIMSCRTLRKIPGISRKTPAAIFIRATRSCCISTGVPYTRVFMYHQKWKSNGVTTGERGNQAIGPPRPIHLLPKGVVQAELILQASHRFTYVTAHSPTPPSLSLRHKLIT